MPYSLRQHNTFGLDATCNHFVNYHNEAQLREALAQLRPNSTTGESPRWLHIGSGSNLLFLRPHFAGTVLHSCILGKEVVSQTEETVVLRVGAGEDWDQLVEYCVEEGYFGLENLSLIPGEVGASAVQNIGAYGTEVGERIVQVETLAVNSGEKRIFQTEECQYGYRSSIFKHELHQQYIVTHVSFRLDLHFTPTLSHTALTQELFRQGIQPEKATASEMRSAVIAVRSSKLPDPKTLGSAGSFFMNPMISAEHAQRLLHRYPNMPHYPTAQGVKVPAAWLIEQCGWKGQRLGGAAVHDKQALVIVNALQASGQEIATLAERIRQDVQARFDISIHPEVLYIE